MKKIFTIAILSLICSFVSSARGKVSSHVGEVPNSYNFWLYEPASVVKGEITNPNTILSGSSPHHSAGLDIADLFLPAGMEEYVPDSELPESEIGLVSVEADSVSGKPVVIFLHGASLCGTDLNRVRRYGTIHAIESGRDMDAYVIAPQNPGGSWNPQKVMALVDWLGQQHDIDRNRIYVLGMSLGGFGAIDMAATYPDKIAAAIGMCGGATVSNLEGLDEIPLWIIHGTADRAVAVSQSDKVVNAIKRVDPFTQRLIYDRVPGMNHSQPARMFYKPETYKWLFSHSLEDLGRPVSPGFDVSPNALRDSYKGLTIKKSGTSTKKKATKRKKSTTRKKSKKK